MAFDGGLIHRQRGDALRRAGRDRRASPAAAGAGRRRPRRRREISRHARCRAPPSASTDRGFLLGHGDADGGMRIDEMAGLAQHGADGGGGLLLVGAVGREDARAAPTARSPTARTAATARARPSARAPPWRRGHRRRTACARNSRRPGCPSRARSSASPRAARRCRSRACARGCR